MITKKRMDELRENCKRIGCQRQRISGCPCHVCSIEALISQLDRAHELLETAHLVIHVQRETIAAAHALLIEVGMIPANTPGVK